ncbi:class I SAM-dependent methyltransferase [Rhodococcoides yunnanense]|uniref:class I SAM-dependent methyltransferase n=1 Tax=Rhodococcoides yunnanense TaxID=278209 RepID=UPI00093268F4|nr:class I SAM-dependent methyltransferase [Rhodococcus yunnanensis]
MAWDEWRWDESLFAGSAPYYSRGRLPYSPALADTVARALSLDGRGRLLDVGCGPGTVALALASHFDVVVGLDPDDGMLAEAEREAAARSVTGVQWVSGRAEDLPGDLGRFDVVTFAQSFHWTDRHRVAAIVRSMLEPGGALVHISDSKDAGRAGESAPPFSAMHDLAVEYLGPLRRAGQGVLVAGTPSGEDSIFRSAGFPGVDRIVVPAGGVVRRDVDDVVAWVFSQSSTAPHLFGDRVGDFEHDLRALLRRAAPDGVFFEHPPDTEVKIWRKV